MKRILALVLAVLVGASPAFAVDINGYLRKAALEPLSSDPSTTLTGRVYFNTTSNGAKVYTGTAWQGLGGSGAGEKNYLATGMNSAAGWTASGAGITCTTTTTGLPDATVGTALAVTGASGSTAFCYYDFDVDQADYSKVLKLSFDMAPVTGYVASDFRVDVYSCTVAFSAGGACSGTLTRLPLSTDTSGVTALPAITGTGTPPPTYSAPNATASHVQVQIGLNGTNTHQMNFAQVLTGPGTVVQSAVATGWYAATAPAGGWISTGPTNVSTVVNEQRTGSSVFLDYTITATGASATFSNLTLNLPNGYAIDTTAMPIVSNSLAIERLGEGQVFRNGSNSGNLFAVSGLGNATQLRVYYEAGTFPDIRTDLTDTAPVSWTNVSNVTYLHLRTKLLPIASMAGQGTVFLGQGVPAYYYGTSCTGGGWGNSGTCTTQQGQGGVLGGATTPSGTFFQYTITPTYSVPVGVTPTLQISADGTHWSPTGGNPTGQFVESLRYDGTQYIGAGAGLNGSGQIVVIFGKYATSALGSWTGTWYWRVFVGYPGQATGFAAATNTARGLMLDRKQYVVGTAYTNGTPAVTCPQAGWTVVRGVLIPYQTYDGAWRLRLDIAGTFTSASVSSIAVTLSGTTFKNVTSYYQPVFGMLNNGSSTGLGESFVTPNTGNITVQAPAAGSASQAFFSGDIELDSKPTWAD